MAIHIVNVQLVNVDRNGNIIPPGKQAPIKDVIEYSTEHRVVANQNVPNSMNWPTMETYLILEDAAGFILRHMDQYKIVTQDL